MKVETSVRLSRELLDAIDVLSGIPGDPSEFLERVAWRAIEVADATASPHEREVAILNAIADGRLAEAPDILHYGNWLSFGDDFEESDFANPSR